MILGTSQLLKRHLTSLTGAKIKMGDSVVEETLVPKVLGVELDQNLKWCNHIKYVLSSCYGKMSTLRKVKNFTSFYLRKNLAESLVMSKIDFNDHVYSPLTQQQLKKLQRLQLSTASFVIGRYAQLNDLRVLNWLPIVERLEFHLLKLKAQSIKILKYSKQSILKTGQKYTP